MHTLTEKCEENKTTHALHSGKFATTNYTGTETKMKKGAIASKKKANATNERNKKRKPQKKT